MLNILVPFQVCNTSNNWTCRLALFYDATVPCFGYEYLPARASEQGNVFRVGVRVYIICSQFFFVIERTRDLIYLKFVATDFSPKIISPSTGENSGDSA